MIPESARDPAVANPPMQDVPAWCRIGSYASIGFGWKRAFDLVVLMLGGPFLLPAMGVVTVLVRVRLGSPVLFRQERPGHHGNIFRMAKFRSMTDARDPAGVSLPDAERLTPFGKRLRSSSLDELPELLNVLRGEMSLVGPRPLLVRYLPLYTPEQARRHDVPPGITGWAQVCGRNALGWEAKFAHDVWYAANASFGLDVYILARTVRAVLLREGISAAGEATMPEFRGTTER